MHFFEISKILFTRDFSALKFECANSAPLAPGFAKWQQPNFPWAPNKNEPPAHSSLLVSQPAASCMLHVAALGVCFLSLAVLFYRCRGICDNCPDSYLLSMGKKKGAPLCICICFIALGAENPSQPRIYYNFLALKLHGQIPKLNLVFLSTSTMHDPHHNPCMLHSCKSYPRTCRLRMVPDVSCGCIRRLLAV